jgi:hypothetical protein
MEVGNLRFVIASPAGPDGLSSVALAKDDGDPSGWIASSLRSSQ